MWTGGVTTNVCVDLILGTSGVCEWSPVELKDKDLDMYNVYCELWR